MTELTLYNIVLSYPLYHVDPFVVTMDIRIQVNEQYPQNIPVSH